VVARGQRRRQRGDFLGRDQAIDVEPSGSAISAPQKESEQEDDTTKK